MDIEYPDPDNLDFERMHDNICRVLMILFDKSPEAVSNSVVAAAAGTALEGEDSSPEERQKAIVAALRTLIKTKQIKKVDDGFCHAKKIPKYRSIDDPVSPYVFTDPSVPPAPRKPTIKKEVVDDMASVLPLVEERFTLMQFAKALSSSKKIKDRIKTYDTVHTTGKEKVREILNELIRRKLIYEIPEQHSVTIYCKSVKKQERYRSLDDEWL